MEQCNTYKLWHDKTEEYRLPHADNAFLEISDVEATQKLSDRFNPEDLHKVLDAFAKRYYPVSETLSLSYTWTIQQIECATDSMFKQSCGLEPALWWNCSDIDLQ